MEAAKKKVIPRKKHKMMCRATIEQIEANNPLMTIIDFSGSSLFSMKVKQYLQLLADALVKNTVVKELYLDDVGLGNKQAEQVAQIISQNKSITNLSLARNTYDGHLGEEFARSLAFNETLVEVDFTGASFQDFSLDAFIEAFNSNITLRKIKWRLESRLSFRITKCITRNNSIYRLKSADRDYSHLLPKGHDASSDFSRAKTAPALISKEKVQLEEEEEEEVLASPEPMKDKDDAKKDEEAEQEGGKQEAEKTESDANAGEVAEAETTQVRKKAELAKEEPKSSFSSKVINREGRSQSELVTNSSGAPAGVKSRKNIWEQKRGRRRSSLVGTKKRKKKLLPRALIGKIKENDPSVVEANFDNSSVFSHKRAEYCQLLHEAMKTNTNVKTISMQLCGIDNACAKHIADIISETETLEKLNLANNRIASDGGDHLAAALEKNSSIVELNLLTIELGNESLTNFLNMFDHNISILNIIWRLDSRLSFRLNKALTRNKEILRRKTANKGYFHLLPNKFRGDEEHAETASSGVAT